MIGQDRIMIFGSKDDGEFRTAAGGALAISVPRTEAAVLKHFQERMPHGLFVPEVKPGTAMTTRCANVRP